MNKYEILKIAQENKGYIYGDIIKKHNIPRTTLTRMVKEGMLNKVDRGIYLTPDKIEDEYFIAQIKYKNLIWVGETALMFHQMSHLSHFINEAIVPFGSFVPKLPFTNVHQSRKKNMMYGVEYAETPYGNMVKAYSKERCICDFFIKDDYEEELKVYAIREYVTHYKNMSKLYETARALNVYDRVREVFEIIGWD